MKKIKQVIFSLLTIISLFLTIQCAQTTIQRKYYLLDYPTTPRDSTLIPNTALPLKVLVQTMKIPRTYDRINVVVRYSSHQIDYYRYSLWAIKPQILVSDLINQQIQGYRLFQKCEREFLDENPDLEVIGFINAIEKFQSDAYTAAHLSMTLYLRRSDDFEPLVKHQFDRQVQLFQADMSFFIKKLSDILREETDLFIYKMSDYFKNQNTHSPNASNPEKIR